MGFIVLVIGYYVAALIGGIILLRFIIWPISKKLFGVTKAENKPDGDKEVSDSAANSYGLRNLSAHLFTALVGMFYVNAIIEYPEPEKVEYDFIFHDERTIAVFKPYDDAKQYRDIEAAPEELVEQIWQGLVTNLTQSQEFQVADKSLTEGFGQIRWDYSENVEPVRTTLGVNYVLEPSIRRTSEEYHSKPFQLVLILREINHHPNRYLWISDYFFDSSETDDVLRKAQESIEMTFGLIPVSEQQSENIAYPLYKMLISKTGS